MVEMVVVGIKGGAGKARLTASLAVLAERPVIADCDIGAAGLQLLLSPQIRERHEFCSGHQAVVRTEECMSCGLCLRYCPNGAIVVGSSLTCSETYSVDPQVCRGCGTCVRTCPVEAIDFPERRCGEWIVSDTRCGPMVHAQLNLAAENFADLVSTIRREAHRIALKENRSLVIVNSPSGIGFPVAASVLGASYVLVVTEPTASGEHDLEAALFLARRHNIPAAVCVNNWDLNVKMTEQIENKTRQMGAQIAGRIRCDRAVTFAERHERAVVELDSPIAGDIRRLWQHMIHNALVDGVIGTAEP